MTSRDATAVAFDRQGRGPAVILVGRGLVDRSENAPLATVLAERFTTYDHDRRGRGESGDASSRVSRTWPIPQVMADPPFQFLTGSEPSEPRPESTLRSTPSGSDTSRA